MNSLNGAYANEWVALYFIMNFTSVVITLSFFCKNLSCLRLLKVGRICDSQHSCEFLLPVFSRSFCDDYLV